MNPQDLVVSEEQAKEMKRAREEMSHPYLWRHLEEIEGALDAMASSSEHLDEMDAKELDSLIYFAKKMKSLADWVLRTAQKTATGDRDDDTPQFGGVIDSVDHPIIKSILAEKRETSELVSKIMRRRMSVAVEPRRVVLKSGRHWQQKGTLVQKGIHGCVVRVDGEEGERLFRPEHVEDLDE